MLFFGTRCERLCMTQFALVSLIPHLLESLQDCASPDLNTYEKSVNRPTNLRTSERSSSKYDFDQLDFTDFLLVLAYVGLPLQLFGLVCLGYPCASLCLVLIGLAFLLFAIYTITTARPSIRPYLSLLCSRIYKHSVSFTTRLSRRTKSIRRCSRQS